MVMVHEKEKFNKKKVSRKPLVWDRPAGQQNFYLNQKEKIKKENQKNDVNMILKMISRS